MKNIKTILSAVLVFQLVIAGGIYTSKNSDREFNQSTKLIAAPIADLQEITIASLDDSGNEQAVSLKRDGDIWRIPSLENLPANATKVEEVLNKLTEIEVTWPVATSTSSHQRFEVKEGSFQRKIVLKSAKGDETLFLGTSPGYRTVHGRTADENDVFTLGIATHEFPTEAIEWLNKGILQTTDIAKISSQDFTLVNQNDTWQFEGFEDSRPLDVEKAKTLATAFSGIRIQGVAEIKSIENPVALEVKVADTSYTYEFGRIDNNYYAKRNDFAPVFVIRDVDYEKIANIKQNELTLQESEEGSETVTNEPELSLTSPQGD